ncbi:MAG: hypothetical protein ACE1ZJ_05875, partial [Nitrospirales bacterium]
MSKHDCHDSVRLDDAVAFTERLGELLIKELLRAVFALGPATLLDNDLLSLLLDPIRIGSDHELWSMLAQSSLEPDEEVVGC